MKFTGKVTYRGWENGPAYGTNKEIELTLSNRGAGTSFNNVTKSDLDNLIKDLNRIKEELENAPMKNAWG
jgi:hypothetical protein